MVFRILVRPENAIWADLISNHDRDLRAAGYLLDKEPPTDAAGDWNRWVAAA